MPRSDIAALSDHPQAPTCGFEYVADLGRLPEQSAEVVVCAVAHASDGRRLELPPVRLTATAPSRAVDEPRAAELRARSARLVARARDASRRRTPERPRRIRLLAFSHQLPYGGASLYLFELLRRFARHEQFECTVVTFEDGPLRPELERLGIPVHVTDSFPVSSLERYEGSLAELSAWAATGDFDVALINSLACFSGAEVARRLGVPAVWAIHESFDLPRFWMTAFKPGTLHPYVRVRAERYLREVAALIFEAEATRRLYLPYADAHRLIAEPYGIELAEIAAVRDPASRGAARNRLGIPEPARLILCLGTIEPRKSQAMLVDAFARVADRHPHALLGLVGEVDAPWVSAYVDGVRERVRRSGHADRARIVPVTPDAYDWHLASDLHVCASDVESLPRSVLEAMAFQRPVVSTRVFGVADLIDDGRTGYLCDTRDAAALAGRLDDALRAEPGELRSVVAAAAAHVFRHHDPDAYADRLWRLVSRLAADPGADPRAALADADQRIAI